MMQELLAKARAQYQSGRLELAAVSCKSIIRDNSTHAEALNLLGMIFHEKGDPARAAESFLRASEGAPGQPDYHCNLAAAYVAQHHYDLAIRACEKALRVNSDHVDARLNLGLALQESGQLERAEREFRWAIGLRQDLSRAYRMLGDCLRVQGRINESLAAYQDAVKRDAGDGLALLSLGTMLLKLAEPGAAEPYLRRAADLLPGMVLAWNNLGTCLLQLGREREALLALQEGLRLKPNDADLLVNVGLAWLACGYNRASENCFNNVLGNDPNHAPALIGLANTQRACDRLETAVQLYERAAQTDSTGDAGRGLAETLWDLGDVQAAVQVLRNAIALRPNDPEIHVQLGRMLASGGDLDRAVDSLRTAMRFRPGHPGALVELAQIVRGKLSSDEQILLEGALRDRKSTRLNSSH